MFLSDGLPDLAIELRDDLVLRGVDPGTEQRVALLDQPRDVLVQTGGQLALRVGQRPRTGHQDVRIGRLFHFLFLQLSQSENIIGIGWINFFIWEMAQMCDRTLPEVGNVLFIFKCILLDKIVLKIYFLNVSYLIKLC